MNTDQAEIDEMFARQDAESSWRNSLPDMDEVAWLQLFPSAKNYYGWIIRFRLTVELEDCQRQLIGIKNEAKRRISGNIYGQWRDEIIKEWAQDAIAAVEKRIRHVRMRLSVLKSIGKPIQANIGAAERITDEMIARAKEYPLDQLLDINRSGFATCLWHDDKHASMYCKGGFVHCFSCQRSGSAVDVVMVKEGLTFKQAVLRLQ